MRLAHQDMLTYAPNISWLFPELTFREKLSEVARLHFAAIEFGFPSYADLDALQEAVLEYGLKIVLFNQDVPVWDRANRGYLVDPARRDEFRRTLDEALQIARRLSVMKIMLPSGVELDGMSPQEQRDCMIENLQYAAPLAADAGVLLTIESLNPDDNPGYFLTTSREGVEIVKTINHPHLRFQFDTYHIQRVEGGVVQRLAESSTWIGHIQFADYPGRHEPGTGEIDFARILSTLEADGSQHYIGLEYMPLAQGAETLNWVPQGMRAPS
jgi:hydroxypyruvate isomerase